MYRTQVCLEADVLYPFEGQGLGKRFQFSIDDLKLKIDSLVGFGLVNLMSGFLLISE